MRALLLAMVVALPVPATAQIVVGQSIIDGRRVELLDDQSWRYVEPSDAECRTISVQVSFCGDPQTWSPIDLDNEKVAAGFRHDDRHYAQYIIEEIGTNDGLNQNVMRQVVIENAAGASGRSPSEIPVLQVEAAEIDGGPGETIVYIADIDGFSFVFANTLYLASEFSMQVISFAVADTYSEKHASLHSNLLTATRISE